MYRFKRDPDDDIRPIAWARGTSSLKTVIICGVSGQDGADLARLLLRRGDRVVGTSRDTQVTEFLNLSRLGIREQVAVESMVLADFRSTLQTTAKVEPDDETVRAVLGDAGRVRLFGSRIDDASRGSDIKLPVEVDQTLANRARGGRK